MEYQTTSVSHGKNGAQITVTVGKRRNRRSFTRHLVRRGSAWIGLNIDERAIPLNERYEQELAEAKSNLDSAEAAVRILQKKLEDISKAPEGDIIAESMLLAAHVAFEEQLEIAQNDVAKATAAVDDAKTKLDIIRQELPLEVEFDGPGLTY